MPETLLSVGIDMGTSTTQLVFSRLTLQNRAAPFSVPQVDITGKEILYKSKIHFTPLLSDTVIDAEAIKDIIRQEYENAHIPKEQVQTGAVIITGETARKENARDVLSALSGFAGDFVVATAGPDLESVLAGAGAGADEYSREHHCTVLHLDIGGGTTNMAFYDRGELLATGCLNVGGRLIKVREGKISYLSPVLQGLTDLSPGHPATEESLSPVVALLCRALEDMVLGKGEAIPLSLRTTPLMDFPVAIDCLSFSGGVADLIYTDSPPAPFAYGDLGVLLGSAIKKSRLFEKTVITPKETIRATVVGAGSHATRLSGSTIQFSRVEFPFKNLPVLAFSREEQEDIVSAIRKKRAWLTSREDTPVLFLPGWSAPSFSRIEQLAEDILQGTDGLPPPLIIVLEQDMGKALGQAILFRAPELPLLCLDGIRLSQGAYLDIGHPVGSGSTLPVVIKTLIFEK